MKLMQWFKAVPTEKKYLAWIGSCLVVIAILHFIAAHVSEETKTGQANASFLGYLFLGAAVGAVGLMVLGKKRPTTVTDRPFELLAQQRGEVHKKPEGTD